MGNSGGSSANIWPFICSAGIQWIGMATKMLVKAPPPPVYSWTGFYVGGNIGYGWGNPKTDTPGSGNISTTVPGLPPNNYVFAGTDTQKTDGVIGGGEFGYNYQYSPKWLIGFEANIQGSDQRKSSALANLISGPLCVVAAGSVCVGTTPLNGAAVTGYDAKIDWFGTVRGRIG
jgi:outer membrane immunogenic protein